MNQNNSAAGRYIALGGELPSWMINVCGFITMSDIFQIQVVMWSVANIKTLTILKSKHVFSIILAD